MKNFKAVLFLFILLVNISFSQNRLADSLNTLLAKEASDTGKVKLLNEIGRAWRKSDVIKARDYYNKAFILSVNQNYLAGMHRSYINIGKLAYVSGNLQSAIDSFYNMAIGLARKKNWSDLLAEDLCFKGDALTGLGKLPEALEVNQEALRIYEAAEKERGISAVKVNLGNIYFHMNQPEKAMECYQAGYEIKKRINDETGQISCLINIAGVASILKDYRKSLQYAKEAERLCIKTGDNGYLPVMYQNLSNTYLNLNKPDSALIFYDKAIEIHKERNNLSALVGALVGKANAYVNMKQNKEALPIIKQAIEIGLKSEDKTMLTEAYEMAGRINFNTGSYREAYIYNKLHDSLKSIILNEKSTKQVNELQAKFETVQKDKELLEKESKIKFQAKENEQKSRERNGFLIGFIIMIVLAVFIFRSLQANKKANKIISKQKELVEEKNHIIEEKQKEIIDSIRYARRIQRALIPSDKLMDKELKRLKK